MDLIKLQHRYGGTQIKKKIMPTRRKFIENALIGGLGGFVSFPSVRNYIDNLHVKKRSVSLEEAREFHNGILIFDAHNDTPVERVARGQDVSTMLRMDKTYQTD